MIETIKFRRSSREGMKPVAFVMLAVLLLYAVSLFVPLLWAFTSAFKDPQTDFQFNILGLPKLWVFNIEYVFRVLKVSVKTANGLKDIGMARMYLNSFLYAIGCSVAHTLIPCVTAYLCARFKYRFSAVVTGVVIATMVLPVVGTLPAEIAMAKTFGLYDRIWGLWIMKANFLGMYFLVFLGTFKSLPAAYAEAAKVDGAGNFIIMVRIMFPLIVKTFLTVVLINFISYWNDYQTPLVFLPSYPTIAIGVYNLVEKPPQGFNNVPMKMACAIMALTPILILFLAFHKRLLGNLTMGGIKG